MYVTDLDTEQINKIVESLERMGAAFIAVCPDDQHAQGFVYPHIAVRFSLDAPTDTMCQKVQKKLLSRSWRVVCNSTMMKSDVTGHDGNGRLITLMIVKDSQVHHLWLGWLTLYRIPSLESW